MSLTELSPAEKLAELPDEERAEILAALSDDDIAALEHDFFGFWARPKQIPPTDCVDPDCDCGGLWRTLIVLCGRGWGKTRFLSEYAQHLAWRYPGIRLIIAAPTAGDARKVVSEGISGLIATAKPWNPFTYKPATSQGEWANGSHILIMSADEPNRARGPQSHVVLCDEFAAWVRATEDDEGMPGWAMLENLRLGLRNKAHPNWPPDFRNQLVIATTPRATYPIKKLVGIGYDKDGLANVRAPKTHIVYGHTSENKANLSENFFDDVVSRLEGTRLGEQELAGKILLDVEGALWKSDSFLYCDESDVPDLKRVVVAVDPNVGGVDETGIVVAGTGPAPGATVAELERRTVTPSATARRMMRIAGYVLADRSVKGASPDAWGRRAIQAYHDYDADCIVAEANNGGELVRHTLNTIDPSVPVKLVHASRGKQTRAEPVAALYEQRRVYHVGRFHELEDQLTTWDPVNSRKSPDRLDALVWALHHLMGKGKVRSSGAPITIKMPPVWTPFVGGP